MTSRAALVSLLILLTASGSGLAQAGGSGSAGGSAGRASHDGRLYDAGIGRSERAASAPEALSEMAAFVGDWDLEQDVRRPGKEPLVSRGIAKVTFMNRGHALMERARIGDFDGQGHAMATMAFLAVNPNGVWTVGEGNSWTESIMLASGGFVGGKLVLHDSIRPGGGPTLVLLRRTYSTSQRSAFEMTLEKSDDVGESWSPLMIRRYRRRAPSPDFFPVGDGIGVPAADRPAEAAQFDFLLGEHEASHWLKRPDRELRWRSNATAVHVLDGHGILEFDWHDKDPSLPDAATSILRLYNRSMRRWESLYLANRGNSPLHFGGVQEGERIVLHPFDAQTGSNPLSQWIFFDIQQKSYRWKGLQSRDRGATFEPTWTIDFVRKSIDDGLAP